MSIQTLTTFCKGCGKIFGGASATMELLDDERKRLETAYAAALSKVK